MAEKILKGLTVFLMLGLGGLIFFQQIDFTSLDLGRHLANGREIFNGPSLLYKNFYSYTEPDYPFVNHHWLSGILYFGLWKIGGFTALNFFNILLALAAVFISFRHSARLSSYSLAALLGLPAILLMSERTDIRPEIFSLLLAAVFLWLFEIWRENEEKGRSNKKLIGIFLILQLLWVNLHVYFFIGLFFTGLFYFLGILLPVLKARFKNICWGEHFKANRERLALTAVVFAISFLNPNFIRGVLYPFNIFRSYGYDIVENKSPFYLEHLMNNPNIFIFKLALIILGLASIFKLASLIRKSNFFSDERFWFHFVFFGFFASAAVFAIRNLPLLGLGTWPGLAYFLYSLSFSAGSETDPPILKSFLEKPAKR